MEERQAFRPDVEGLRAVAVIAVVLFHVGVLHGGFVGVDVFFVVSGFLITGLLWRDIERTGRVRFGDFYARRARRILPMAVLVLVATVVAAHALLPPLRAQSVARDGLAAGLYVGNHRFASAGTDYLAVTDPSPLLHYWSLAVEEQFYLVWPALLLGLALLARGRRGFVAVGVAAVVVLSFALCVRWTATSEPSAFFLLPARAWELAMGALVAFAAPWLGRVRRRGAVVAGWTGFAVVLVAVATTSADSAFPGPMAAVPVLGTALVLAAGSAAGRHGPVQLLRHRPLQVVGRHSYGWYLWHWPALVLAAGAAGHELPLPTRLALAAAAGGGAVATSHLVEARIRFSPLLARRAAWSLALGVLLTGIAVGTSEDMVRATPSLHGDRAARVAVVPVAQPKETSPASVSPAQAAVAAAIAAGLHVDEVPSNLQPDLPHAGRDSPTPFHDGCNDGYTDVGVRRCTYGDPAATTSVVLFGDSHAAQWFPALDAAARQRGWRLVSLTKSTCPPVLLSIWSPVLHRPFRECDTWHDAALARIRAEHPALVILGAARHYGPEYHFDIASAAWTTGLHAMVERITSGGSAVLVLGPMPKPGTNIPQCLSVHVRAATIQCTQPVHAVFHQERIAAERVATESAGGSYLDVAPWLCDREWCAVIVGNLLVYRDDNHITTPYSAWLAPVVGEQVARRLRPDAPAPAARPQGSTAASKP